MDRRIMTQSESAAAQPGRVGEHELPQVVLVEDPSIANKESRLAD
jgi:hypothetical protein